MEGAAGYPADWVAIPVAGRPIPAYSKVTREFLIDPKTGQLATLYVPPSIVPKNAILKLSGILGRVVARQKTEQFCFTEDDFLPAGTRPGVVGGTPAGKRAITLDAGKLKGVHDLKEGDHLDLLASVPVDMPGAGHSGGRMGANVVASPDAALLPKRSLVRPLVEDGVVVTPVRVRNVPVGSMQGGTVRTGPWRKSSLPSSPRRWPVGGSDGPEVRNHLRGSLRPAFARSRARPESVPRRSVVRAGLAV